MSDWKPKRFWKDAAVTETADGFGVLLDGRPVNTPAKAPLIVPTEGLAKAIAAEWNAQVKELDPQTMPVTKGANAAIDKVRIQRPEVVGLLAEYGDSDLLCYRAAGPDSLIQRQAEGWDPVLDWAANALGARLFVGEGVMHVPQTAKALALLRTELETLDDFGLAAAHDMISITGSLVLALAVINGVRTEEEAWHLSRIDEHWQIEQWGEDEEAAAAEKTKCQAFFDAVRFYRLSLR